ncbi:MAG: hypothetical protein ACK45R_03535, partial [Candidatus Kapaibacterium sp.]
DGCWWPVHASEHCAVRELTNNAYGSCESCLGKQTVVRRVMRRANLQSKSAELERLGASVQALFTRTPTYARTATSCA